MKSQTIHFDSDRVLDIIKTELRNRGLQHTYEVKLRHPQIVVTKLSGETSPIKLRVDKSLTFLKLKKVLSQVL